MTKEEMEQKIENTVCYQSSIRGWEREAHGLTSEYLCFEHQGCIICTTDERYYEDPYGPIAMILPDGKAIIIGEIADEEAPKHSEKPDWTFDKDTGILTQKYRYYVDNSHHHGGWDYIKTDCNYTPELQFKADMGYLCVKLKKEPFTYMQNRSVKYSLRYSPTKEGIQVTGYRSVYRNYSWVNVASACINVKIENGEIAQISADKDSLKYRKEDNLFTDVMCSPKAEDRLKEAIQRHLSEPGISL